MSVLYVFLFFVVHLCGYNTNLVNKNVNAVALFGYQNLEYRLGQLFDNFFDWLMKRLNCAGQNRNFDHKRKKIYTPLVYNITYAGIGAFYLA